MRVKIKRIGDFTRVPQKLEKFLRQVQTKPKKFASAVRPALAVFKSNLRHGKTATKWGGTRVSFASLAKSTKERRQRLEEQTPRGLHPFYKDPIRFSQWYETSSSNLTLSGRMIRAWKMVIQSNKIFFVLDGRTKEGRLALIHFKGAGAHLPPRRMYLSINDIRRHIIKPMQQRFLILAKRAGL